MTKTDIACKFCEVEYAYSGSKELALSGIGLEIKCGQWLALLGPNGCGKSTFAKLCNALLLPTQGDCFICGNNTKMQDIKEIRNKVALVFQNPDNQIVASIVEEEVAFGPENLGIPRDEIRRRVDESLQAVGLEGKARAATYALSGGQKQRLALAGALAMGSDILILDEATSMIDPQGRANFLNILTSLKKTGKTIIQITHRLEETIAADRAVVLKKGKIVFDGKPIDLYSDTRNLKKMGLHCPPLVTLYNELLSAGVIPRDTQLSGIVEALK